MSYKIAVASSDGIKIDRSFGAADFFDIYEVEETEYHLFERREYSSQEAPEQKDGAAYVLTANSGEEQRDCGTTGCGPSGSCGSGKGCGASSGNFPKVELICDCRCIVCEKIGFQIQKQLEKMAITAFDIDCTVEEALEKITAYLQKMDHHQSLRGIRKEGM